MFALRQHDASAREPRRVCAHLIVRSHARLNETVEQRACCRQISELKMKERLFFE